MTRKPHRPWITRLPTGLREQPAWVFIGFMVGLVGVSYVTGLTQSSIAQAVGPIGIRIWGAFLMASGFGVVWATIRAKHALERMALRFLSTCMFVYLGWLLTVVPIRRASMAVLLGLVLIGLAEIHMAVLKSLYRATDERRNLWL